MSHLIKVPLQASEALRPQNAEILQRQRLAVRREGEQVVFTIGNVDMKFDYETALTLSQWLRVHGKAAKLAAGNPFPVLRALADLSFTRD